MAENYWEDRRVLVTGGSGFIGSWLVKAFIELGSNVFVFVRDLDPQSEFFRSGDYLNTSIVQGELEDFRALKRAINEHEVEFVFHLGAQAIVGVAHRDPLQTFESNIRGTYNLLEACLQCRHLITGVVVASSDKAYGTKSTLPYKENMALEGTYPYEVSKSAADLISSAYASTYQLPITIARFGNVYGGGDLNWSRIIPDTIRSCLQGKPLIVRSDGTYVRDYIYVKDAVQAFIRLAENVDRSEVMGEAFNFSPGKPVTVLAVVDQIRRLIGCELEPQILNSTAGEIHSQYLDSSKAERVLGWRPAFSLEEGLSETITWYREYLNKTLSLTSEER